MRKSLTRFAVCLFALAAISTVNAPSASAAACPGNIVIGGTMACHNTPASSDCTRCRYLCDDGLYYTWNMCAVE
jgi:hypothetical protein